MAVYMMDISMRLIHAYVYINVKINFLNNS